MKKSLLLVVVLLAVASLMAVMAYTSATVTNHGTIEIVNTTDALLSLSPGSAENAVGHKDGTVRIENGNLVFDFGRGIDEEMYGLQRNSVYEWKDLIAVKSNSEDKIKRYFEAVNVPDDVTIEIWRTGWENNVRNITNKKDWDGQGASGKGYNIKYSLRITVGKDAVIDRGLQDMQIKVYGEAIAD